jgi:hypothetical protein
MNRKSCTILALLTLLLSTSTRAGAEDLAPRVQASKTAVMAFAAALRGELQTAMKSGGPMEAISVCSEKAPAIAEEQSARNDLRIGRTSLKVRNQGNRPDAWEKVVLEDFERRRGAGADPATLVRYEVVDTGNRREFRFMKAIPTAKACLACHGSTLAPEVAARLDTLYPEDQARGFAVGDLRGAFTVRQPME